MLRGGPLGKLMWIGALLTLLSAGALTSAAVPARAATVYPGSCYDARYFDGLSSRWAASKCSQALTLAGYGAAGLSNATAAKAFQRSFQDAVFFHAGHSLDVQDDTQNVHAGVGLTYESPNSSGDIDVLAAEEKATPLLEGALVSVCSQGGGCRTQNYLLAYPLTAAQEAKMNLAVFESCATVSKITFLGVGLAGAATAANSNQAGTAIGWTADIGFPVNVDDSGAYGDGWANRFWSDLGEGVDYTTAMVDAANSVGNSAGLGTYYEYHKAGAPTRLYSAGYHIP